MFKYNASHEHEEGALNITLVVFRCISIQVLKLWMLKSAGTHFYEFVLKKS